MVRFYHFSFHSSIGHHGPTRAVKSPTTSEKPLPKVTSPVVPETASEITAHETASRILRRVDLRLVPILSALCLLCFLCKQNIGNRRHIT
jgi:hypothetical protein